jgi:hypothetical protein
MGMKLSQLSPAEQSAAIERMIRDLFAGLDAEDRTIAERWLEDHLAGFSDADIAFVRHVSRFVTKLGRLQSVKLTMAEFEALWAATDEPDTGRRMH